MAWRNMSYSKRNSPRTVCLLRLSLVVCICYYVRIILLSGHYKSISNDNDAKNEPSVSDLAKEKNNHFKGMDFQKKNEYHPIFFSKIQNEIIRCRLGLEGWMNPLIDQGIEWEVPLLDWAWDMGDYTMIMLMTEHLQSKRRDFFKATWYCGGNTNTTTVATVPKQHRRYHGDILFVKCANVINVTSIRPSIPSNQAGSIVSYNLEPLLHCDRIEKQQEAKLIQEKKIKLGACLRFSGDSRPQVLQWIIYHRMIGFDKFWVFLNEPMQRPLAFQGLPLWEDVTYIPYNYNWAEHRNKTRTSFRPPYKGNDYWHTTQMHQCLYKAKRSGMDWVTSTDLDEYIWLSDQYDGDHHKNDGLKPMQRFLAQYNTSIDHNIGALTLNSIPFGQNIVKETLLNHTSFPLVMDYTYRSPHEHDCNHPYARCKCLYNPNVAENIGIHWLFRGGTFVNFDTTQVRIHHYKTPQAGVYNSRSIKQIQKLIQDTSLVDRYRSRVIQALKDANSSIIAGF